MFFLYTACVAADFQQVKDLIGAELHRIPQLENVSRHVIDDLQMRLKRQAERGTKRVAPPSKDVAVRSTRARSDIPRTNAILAVVKLKAAAKTAVEFKHPIDLGAKQGLLALDMQFDTGLDEAAWVRQVIGETVALSAPGSISLACSVLRRRAAFADSALNADGDHLPPSVGGLTAWSRLFRNSAAFTNYVNYLRIGCNGLGLDSSSMKGGLLTRAKATLKKQQGPPRTKSFIQAPLVESLVKQAMRNGAVASGMLYIAGYAFLLRVPSELLPATIGDAGEPLVALE